MRSTAPRQLSNLRSMGASSMPTRISSTRLVTQSRRFGPAPQHVRRSRLSPKEPEYRAFWEKLGRGEFIADKFKRIAKGGREVWIQASYNPILDQERKAVQGREIRHRHHRGGKSGHDVSLQSAAFEGSSVAMMMIDRDFKVTYVNDATKRLLKENVVAFRAIWPTFDPDKIIGTCIDTFHKSPAHQRQILSDPSRLPYRTDISVGDLKFALSVGGVFDARRNYVGNVLEWDNVTETRVNAGMIMALQRSQAIIEFSLDGPHRQRQEEFPQYAGLHTGRDPRTSITGCCRSRLFARARIRSFWERLGRGEFIADEVQAHRQGRQGGLDPGHLQPDPRPEGKPLQGREVCDRHHGDRGQRRRNEEERAAKAAGAGPCRE